MSQFKRWLHRIPFAFALAVLLVMGWGAVMVSSKPYDGFEMNSRTGYIYFVDMHGPSSGLLNRADIIISIEGISFPNNQPLFDGKSAGDDLELLVISSGSIKNISINLTTPTFDELIRRIVPYVVAFFFWFVGVVVFAYQPDDSSSRLFYTLSLMGCVVLVIGSLTEFHPNRTISLFGVMLVLIGPLVILFHINFPFRTHLAQSQFLFWLYGLAGVGVILFFLLFGYEKSDLFRVETQSKISRSWLTSCLLISVALLGNAYRQAKSGEARGRIRLVILGGVLGFAPISTLSILPDLLFGFPILPFHIGFLLLGILPIAYGYAILQHRLIDLGPQVSRAATQVMVAAMIGGFYLIVVTAFQQILPQSVVENPVALTGIVLTLAILYPPLQRAFQNFLDKAFYGGWYNFRQVVAATSQELSQPMNPERLNHRMLAILKIMRFHSAALLWLKEGRLTIQDGYGSDLEELVGLNLPVLGSLVQSLEATGHPIWQAKLQAQLAGRKLAPAEIMFLNLPQARLWIPLISRGELRGVLLIGARSVDPWLSVEDLDILKTLAALAAVAADNVELIDSLQLQLAEVEQAHQELAESQRRLLEGREAERIRLARELHDGPIQNLHALRLQLGVIKANGRALPYSDFQERLVEIVRELRDVCTQLRPPALAHFGLETGIQSLAEQIRMAHSELVVQVDVQVSGGALPEQVQMALYRICQEALNNVVQHARAQHVLIRFEANDIHFDLTIRDDGDGFEVPDRWIRFARHGHLGLLGISERAESVGGRLEIESSPGKGTSLRVFAPRPELLANPPRQEDPIGGIRREQ